MKSSEKNNVGVKDNGDCVSMESMVTLPSAALEAHYRAGLAHLKAGKVILVIDRVKSYNHSGQPNK